MSTSTTTGISHGTAALRRTLESFPRHFEGGRTNTLCHRCVQTVRFCRCQTAVDVDDTLNAFFATVVLGQLQIVVDKQTKDAQVSHHCGRCTTRWLARWRSLKTLCCTVVGQAAAAERREQVCPPPHTHTTWTILEKMARSTSDCVAMCQGKERHVLMPDQGPERTKAEAIGAALLTCRTGACGRG